MPGNREPTHAHPLPARLSRAEALAILEARARTAQHELASQVDAGDDVLGYLARNGALATRRAVAANIAAPATANRQLADDESADVRGELARKIARLMPDLPTDECNRLRELTIETLERLARDQEPCVRAILAEEIKSLACVPRSVVRALARDIETIVARPILEYSPLLSDADLMEIVATAKASEALSAIARRAPLSLALSDAIVSSLDIPAVAALLANAKAEVRAETLEKIVEQAERVVQWHRPLTLRTDLSARAIRRLASFVGLGLIEQLASRRGLDEETQRLLGKRLKTRLEQGDDLPTGAAALALAEVAAAARLGTLDDRFVEAAADTGRRETVIAALATLAKVPPETVKRILASGTARPITALVWHAGLGMRAAFKIQSSVMRLHADELLPAHKGVNFPLTEEEMRWHLNYFDVVVGE